MGLRLWVLRDTVLGVLPWHTLLLVTPILEILAAVSIFGVKNELSASTVLQDTSKIF